MLSAIECRKHFSFPAPFFERNPRTNNEEAMAPKAPDQTRRRDIFSQNTPAPLHIGPPYINPGVLADF
ncbi:MAG: hypothetical protein D6714_03215 [Bacteroidetes bacterium]|nr:MAG: hypothetical protein D6714_03215 [Bacteroidota bacterium]